MDKRKALPALFATLALAGLSVAFADNRNIGIDYGVEASADTVLLPSSSSGSVVLTCASCQQRAYSLDSSTTFYVGQSAVSLAQMTAYLHTLSASQPLTIFITRDGSRVTRIVVPGQLSR